MDDLSSYRHNLLGSLERAGFIIRREEGAIVGFLEPVTFQEKISCRIAFKVEPEGILFRITIGAFWLQRHLSYNRLMFYPPRAEILIPVVIRMIFCETGDEIAASFWNTLSKPH